MSKHHTLLIVAASFCAWVLGCAAKASDTADDDMASDEAAVSSMKYYDCNRSGDEQMAHVEVGISAKTLNVTDVSKNAAPPSSGRIHPDYHPTAAYAGAVRYDGFGELAATWDEVATVQFIVSPDIQRSAAQGKIWMRTAGGGGDTTMFTCKAKAKKLAPDTTRRTRLLCDLKQLCTQDNPPGDTCLDEAFINQTSANGSTLRTTYFDHYGVNAKQRRVNVGASSATHRDAKGFSGEWSGHKIDLTYRAGITYLGTFTLPDGRITEAQCNDLAMLD